MKWIKKIISLPFFCPHDYMIHGWSYAKCKICGYVTTDSKIVNQVYDALIESRTEGMKKAGFSDEYIFKDNSQITPLKHGNSID